MVSILHSTYHKEHQKCEDQGENGKSFLLPLEKKGDQCKEARGSAEDHCDLNRGQDPSNIQTAQIAAQIGPHSTQTHICKQSPCCQKQEEGNDSKKTALLDRCSRLRSKIVLFHNKSFPPLGTLVWGITALFHFILAL